MADKKQTSTTVLAYSIDEKSVSRVLKTTDSVEQAINDSVAGLGDYGPRTKANVLAVEQGFKSLDRNLTMHQQTIDDLADLYGDLARQEQRLANTDWAGELRQEANAADDAANSYERLEKAKRGSADVSTGGGLENARQGVGDLSSLLGAAGSAVGGNSGLSAAGDILGFIEYAPLATSALTALNPPMLALAAAGSVFALVIGENQRRFEEATKAAEDYAARQDALAQLTAAGATSADYQQQIDDARAAQDNLLADTGSLEAYKGQIDSIRGTIIDLVNEIQTTSMRDPYSERIGQLEDLLQQAQAAEQQLVSGVSTLDETLTSYDALSIAIEKNKENIDEYAQQIADAEAEMRSAGVAENDRRQAIADAEAEADQQVRQQMEIEREADAMTAEQRRERIQQLIAEREAIQRALSEQGISVEYYDELQSQLEGVNERIDWFGENLDTTADKLDRVVKAREELEQIETRVTDSTDAVLDANTRLTEAYQSALEATNAYNTALFEHEEALNQLILDNTAKREQLEAKANEERLKAEQQTAKKVSDIRRKSDASLIAAIANRDELAYKQAKDAQDEQIRQEETAYDERERELRDSLQKQLADQDRAHRQAIDRENQRWEQERQTRVRANQQALIDTQNAENAQRMLQQQSNVAALTLMQYRATGEAQLYESMARNAEFWVQWMVNRTAAAWQAVASATASPLSGGGGGVGRAMPTPFADGGIVTSPGLAMLHSPEIIVPLKPAGRAPLSSVSNITNTAGGININVTGSTRSQVRAQVYEELESAMSQAGLIE